MGTGDWFTGMHLHNAPLQPFICATNDIACPVRRDARNRPRQNRTSLMPPFSGDMPMRLATLLSRDPKGGVPALFAGRKVSFSFNTRVAIRQACDLLGLRPGDEVLAPAYHCGSELDPLRHAGLTVRLYPVDPATRIDLAELTRRITARTRAVYVIHYFGVLHPDLAALRALCDASGLVLIEDCALSLLSGTAPAEGRSGDVALFCFYKFFPSLGGGALVINRAGSVTGEPGFARPAPAGQTVRPLVRAALNLLPGSGAALRQLRQARHRRPAPLPSAAAPDPDMPAGYYFDPRLTDARMSPLTRRALASFDVAAAIAARRAHYRRYLDLLAGMPGVTPLFPTLAPDTCPLAMPVLVENRDALAAALAARGIAATPWWAGYHRHLDFSDQPAARHLKDHLLALPVHQYLAPGAMAHVAATLQRLAAAAA
jgi:perosamine synthetase